MKNNAVETIEVIIDLTEQWLDQIDEATQSELADFMITVIKDHRLMLALAAYAYMRTNFTVHLKGVENN